MRLRALFSRRRWVVRCPLCQRSVFRRFGEPRPTWKGERCHALCAAEAIYVRAQAEDPLVTMEDMSFAMSITTGELTRMAAEKHRVRPLP